MTEIINTELGFSVELRPNGQIVKRNLLTNEVEAGTLAEYAILLLLNELKPSVSTSPEPSPEPNPEP